MNLKSVYVMHRGFYKVIAMLFVIIWQQTVFGQDKAINNDTVKIPESFTLQEAQAFALSNSPVMKNAILDLESAKKKIWETTAIGLPQVSGKFSYSYMLTVAEQIEQFQSLGQLGSWMYLVDQTMWNMQGQNPASPFGHIPMPDTSQQSNTDDYKWGLTLDITVSQLIFSGAYLVGLQTAKVYKGLSEIAITKSENDLKQSIANTYMLVLIVRENTAIVDSTFQNTQKTLNDVKELLNNGMIEDTDVDQLQLTVNTLANMLSLLKNQEQVTLKLLKYQMGIELNKNIVLKDGIASAMDETKIAQMLTSPFDVNAQPEIQLMNKQEQLMKLNVKLNRYAFLPDVAAFYQHQEQFNDKSFSFTPPDIVGVSVNIPIWSSGMRHARLQQAKIGLNKTQNSKLLAEQGMLLDFEQSKMALSTAYDKYKNQKQSLALSKRIYDKTLVKYKEGMSSSLDLTQAQNQFLNTQTAFYNALLELLNAKIKMNKLLNVQ